MASGRLAQEIVPVFYPAAPGRSPSSCQKMNTPRPSTTLEALQKLKSFVKADGTVTAGNASGVNDGAAALILATKEAAEKHGLTPIAKVLGGATVGVAPRIMGFGPAPASKKLMARRGLKQEDFS
ncbi:3-oxoadipyl-CoA thiolase, partial [Sulfitobacter pontiacus]